MNEEAWKTIEKLTNIKAKYDNAIAKIEERIKKWKEGIETEKRLGMDDGSMNREYRVLIMEDEIIVELLKGE